VVLQERQSLYESPADCFRPRAPFDTIAINQPR